MRSRTKRVGKAARFTFHLPNGSIQGPCPHGRYACNRRVRPGIVLALALWRHLAARRRFCGRSDGISCKEDFLPAFVLKLYVTGATPRANLAIANLRRICEQELQGDYELQIIDVLEHPQLAEDERILATPTLIKQLPPPLRRVIGDLSDSEKVLLGLELRPRDSTSTPKTDT